MEKEKIREMASEVIIKLFFVLEMIGKELIKE